MLLGATRGHFGGDPLGEGVAGGVLEDQGAAEGQAIAAGVPDIDLVVGGHSHSLLYTGPPPSVEKPEGPYPTLVRQPGTRRFVPVVQAYAFTKYMGLFKMQFDEEGEVVAWEGQPKLLDGSIAQGDRMRSVLLFKFLLD